MPEKSMTVIGIWSGADLIWVLRNVCYEGDVHSVSDKDLRAWCHQNMPYPSNQIAVVNRGHVEAYIKGHYSK